MISGTSQKGFTLIELMVVIAIISLLSSIMLASFSGARSSTRNAQRLRDLTTMRTALELYAQDHQGHYPLNIGPGVGADSIYSFTGTTPGCAGNDGTIDVASGLVAGKYISKLPQDPKPVLASNYCYEYYGVPDPTFTYGIAYKFMVFQTMENFSNQTPTKHPLRDPRSDPAVTTCKSTGGATNTATLAVYSSGGECQ